MNKKYYPWIPIMGFWLTLKYSVKETGIDNDLKSWASAFIQGVSFAIIFTMLIIWIFQ